MIMFDRRKVMSCVSKRKTCCLFVQYKKVDQPSLELWLDGVFIGAQGGDPHCMSNGFIGQRQTLVGLEVAPASGMPWISCTYIIFPLTRLRHILAFWSFLMTCPIRVHLAEELQLLCIDQRHPFLHKV